jgi:hypothetical protein
LVGGGDGAAAHEFVVRIERVEAGAVAGAGHGADLGRARPELVGHVAQHVGERGADGRGAHFAAAAGEPVVRQRHAGQGNGAAASGFEGQGFQAARAHVHADQYVGHHVITASAEKKAIASSVSPSTRGNQAGITF